MSLIPPVWSLLINPLPSTFLKFIFNESDFLTTKVLYDAMTCNPDKRPSGNESANNDSECESYFKSDEGYYDTGKVVNSKLYSTYSDPSLDDRSYIEYRGRLGVISRKVLISKDKGIYRERLISKYRND